MGKGRSFIMYGDKHYAHPEHLAARLVGLAHVAAAGAIVFSNTYTPPPLSCSVPVSITKTIKNKRGTGSGIAKAQPQDRAE